MSIKRNPRVNYEKNPIVEVACQFTFPKFDVRENNGVERFREAVAAVGFFVFKEGKAASFVVEETLPDEVGESASPQVELSEVYSFATLNGDWKVSLSSGFLEASSTSYRRWEDFKAPLMDAARVFSVIFSTPSLKKISLRYKDVIEREALGLHGVPWRDLLAPFIVGMLDADIFDEEGPHEDFILQQNSQSLLALPECKLLLQSALLHSMSNPGQQAFLIDSDFFAENPNIALAQSEDVDRVLDVLHDSAGALFRNCIQGRLHDALCPTPI